MDKKRLISSKTRERLTPYLLILPAIALTFFTVGYPIIYNFCISFMSWEIRSPEHKFIGFENYEDVLADDFLRIFGNTLVWTVGCVALALILGLVLACYVDGRKHEKVYRSFLLLPWIIPSIIVVFIWRWILQSDLGILNYFLQKLHIIDEPILWMSDKRISMLTVILVNTWKAYTTWFIMLLAGLKSLPRELVESASIDGANQVHIFFNIKLPHLKPVILSTGILCIIWAINYVELIYTLTGGGPQNATMILPVKAYILGFEVYDFGRSSAMATLTLLTVVILIIPYIRMMFKQLKTGGD